MVKIFFSIAVAILAVVLYFFHMHLDGKNRLLHPQPIFNFDKDVTDDQVRGKVMIITGGNTGLGRGAAEVVAERLYKIKDDKAKIIITSRTKESAEAAAKEINEYYGKGSTLSVVIGMQLDLGSHQSILDFARKFRAMGLPLNILMLNAGIYLPTFQLSADGYETQIAVNWLGHFYLQHLLQDLIEKSAPSRVVILTSAAHLFAKPYQSSHDVLLDTPENRKTFDGFAQYGNSKLLNNLHSFELNQRLRSKGINNIYVNAVHPGLVSTDLARHVNKQMEVMSFWAKFIRTLVSWTDIRLDARTGAMSQLYAAYSSDIEKKGISGKYILPLGRVVEDETAITSTLLVSKRSIDKEFAKKVWEEGEKLISKWPTQ